MPEPSRKRWTLPADSCPPGWRESGAGVGLPRAAVEVLWNRGLRSEEQIRGFLQPDLRSLADPFLLSGVAAAADRLGRALRTRERVFVFGDFDADGLAASALAVGVLRALARRRSAGSGLRAELPDGRTDADPASLVQSISPDRSEGFGLTERVVREVHARGGRVLLTVDCGTSANHAIGIAGGLGLDIVVADHHGPRNAIPEPAILVNPCLPGQRYPFRDLAAVGVLHRILDAMTREDAEEAAILGSQLDLVALGTVADLVPLAGENRILAWHGLRCLRERARPAWPALANSCGLDPAWISSIDIAYKLAPRLNAPGRLGSPARSIDLLLARDAGEARILAARVEDDNRERRGRHEKILKDALLLLRTDHRHPPGPIVLGSRDWAAGVLGIVASRLVETYRVPVVLVSLQGEIARGSARTLPGHNLLTWLDGARHCLEQYGGHPQAAGVSMRPDRFDEFRESLLRCQAPASGAETAVRVDARLDPIECDLGLARALEGMAPFGAGNEEPLFFGRCTCRKVRRERARHLRFLGGEGNDAPDCIGFGMARGGERLPHDGSPVDLVYVPVVNRHRGEERLQLKVRGLRAAQDEEPPAAPGEP